MYRALEPSDDAIFYAMKQNPTNHLHVSAGLPIPVGNTSASKTREFIQNAFLGVAITLPGKPNDDGTKGESTTIGFTCLRLEGGANHHRTCAVGISVRDEYQNKGYGGEALRWLLEWGFRHANLHRIEIAVFEWNVNAKHLYEKLGFRHEGTKKEALWFDGRWWDEIGYAMLKKEWKEKYGNQKTVTAEVAKSGGM